MSNNPSDLKAAVIGATGLTGTALVTLLCDHVQVNTVNCITRKPIALSHPKQLNSLFDPADEQSLKNAIGKADLIFCAIGTTFRKMKGDLDAYRKIDHDIPLRAARHGADINCRHFSLVLAVGADTESKNYYLKIKGDTEEDIRSLGLASASIFRPSLLLGKRKEQRPLERVGQFLMEPLSFLIPSKYKPIRADDVAKAMTAEAMASRPGFHILHYREMKAYCR